MTQNKLKPEVKTKWLQALRSGEFDQGRLKLHNTENNTYCCLGVLCDIAIENGLEVNTENIGEQIFYDEFAASLPPSVRYWAFEDATNNFDDLVSLNNDILHYNTLASLNDSNQYDFNRIADIIDEQF